MNTSRYRSRQWLALPALIHVAVFCLIPSIFVLVYSFLKRDFYGQVIPEYSLDGWRQVADPITLALVLRSFLLAVGVTAACLLAAFPSAIALARMAQPWRQVCSLLILFPLVTSLLLRVYGWMNLLPPQWRGTLWTVGLVMVVNYLPFMLLPLLRAVERIDADLPRAAADLGATPWRAFWLVTWPATRGGVWAGCCLVFIPATGEYMVPHFIGEGNVSVLGTLIVQQFMERRNWPYAAAAAVVLLSFVLLPMMVWFFGTLRHGLEGAGTTGNQPHG